LNPLLVAFVSMSAGAVITGYVAFQFGSGVGAQAGVAKGFSDGACATMEAARLQGLVTVEQYDDVLNAAAKIASRVEVPGEARSTNTAAKCQQVIAKLQQSKVEER